MSEFKIYPPSADFVANAKITAAQYDEMYARSVNDPDGFWGEAAERLDWIKKPTNIKNTTFEYPDVSIKWFEDGELNVVGQLHRPASRDPRRPGRDHLGIATTRTSTRTSPTTSWRRT